MTTTGLLILIMLSAAATMDSLKLYSPNMSIDQSGIIQEEEEEEEVEKGKEEEQLMYDDVGLAPDTDIYEVLPGKNIQCHTKRHNILTVYIFLIHFSWV